ncbi:methyltransferase, partial [Candidatus Micrarchaeota archaeon]|nr:methyltransferase [Candidatus Micrarchaeota archaeon]
MEKKTNYLDSIKIKADDKKVYLPREDSYLLARALEEHLKQNKYDLVIDIGCGSGILSILAAKYIEKVITLDINEEAISQAKKNARLNHENKILFFKSDLLQKFRIISKNTLIVFNPPYLPSQKIKYIDLDG